MEGGPVIGRETELAAIERFVGDVAAGPLGLLIEGEAGIGKTTLWDRAVSSARARSYRVLVCRPTGSEARLSFAALGDLLSELPEEVAPVLPEPQRRALDVALLRAEVMGRPPDRRAVSLAVLGVLREASRAAPLLVAVDDLQWIDTPSARVLEFVLRRLRSEPIGLIASLRSERRGGPLPIEVESAMDGRLVRLGLGPLSVGALHHVLRARLGVSIGRSTLIRLHRASGGNPFFALEIARALDLESPDGGSAPLPVPDNLRRLVLNRLGRLPEDVRETLFVAASLDHPTLALVEQARGRRSDLRRAIESGIVEIEGERIGFTHPLLSSVLSSAYPASEHRRVHRRLAEIVDEPEQRARHLALAAERADPAVADALDAAAGAARARGAPDAAAELGELADRLTPSDRQDDRRRRAVQAAEDRFTAGDATRAGALLRGVVETLPPGPERADALGRLARVEYHSRGFEVAAALLRQALGEAGKDARLRAVMHYGLSFVCANLGDTFGAEAHAQDALRLARGLDEPILLAHVLAAAALARFLRGGGIPRPEIERSLSLEVRPPDLPVELRPAVMGGRLLGWAGELDEGRRLLEPALRLSQDRGEEDGVAIIAFYLAELECWAGRMREARSHARTASEAARLVGNDALRTYVLHVSGLMQALAGDVRAARATAREGLGLARRVGARPGLLFHRSLLGFIELSVGDHAAAHEHLAPLAEAVERFGIEEPTVVRFVPDEVEALVALGRLDEAEPLVRGLQERGRTLDRPWAIATGARCRALMLAAEGRLEEAASELDRALEEHERLPVPFELARTLLLRGAVERRLRRKLPARHHLGQALAIFEGLGTPLWAARARGEIARIGGRRSSPAELTETERRVAELVATGMTNRQVAGALFMSPHTVDANLRRVYRKLGIRSRTELARAL